jgi:DNA-binding NtrC family response regulator
MTSESACPEPMTNRFASPETECKPGILIVDDDSMLLRLLQTVFVRQGFAVWTAVDGRTATDLYRQNQSAIAVVLLDVNMPEMDGVQTLQSLQGVNPGVRAVFMSGYTGKYLSDDLLSAGGMRFVEKPFDIVPLAEQMWQLAQPETSCSV